jgi:SAM-dependent methyltransferase
MNYNYSNITLTANDTCLVCGSKNYRVLGRRGNREYFGADKVASPHLVTNIVKCSECEFVFISPSFHGADAIESEFYGSAETYYFDIDKTVESMFQQRVDLLKKHLFAGSGLDVGCGRGEFLRQLARSGYAVRGVEPSVGLSEFAAKTAGVAVMNCKLEDAIISEPVDFISSTHSLEHMDHPQAFLATALNLLKDDGVLFVEVPNTEAAIIRVLDFVFKITGIGWSSRLCPLHPPFHKHGYNLPSLSRLLTDSGFTISESLTLTGTDRGYTRYKGFRGVASAIKLGLTYCLELFGQKECLVVVARKRRTT